MCSRSRSIEKPGFGRRTGAWVNWFWLLSKKLGHIKNTFNAEIPDMQFLEMLQLKK